MKKQPHTVVIASGAARSVECAVRASQKVPTVEFLAVLDANAQAKAMHLFQQMANFGRLSPKRFDKEMRDLYAFKFEARNVQIRFPCFPDGRKWIVTHGFRKPGAKKGRGKWPQEEINRALEIQREYYRQLGDE